MAWAEEDDTDDEIVDVEGDSDETSVTDEGTEDDEAQPGTSPDADTTILFTKPTTAISGANLGMFVTSKVSD